MVQMKHGADPGFRTQPPRHGADRYVRTSFESGVGVELKGSEERTKGGGRLCCRAVRRPEAGAAGLIRGDSRTTRGRDQYISETMLDEVEGMI